MKIVSTILAAAIAAAALMPAGMSAQKADRRLAATQAVMRVYDEELQADPTNYNVYFRRAHLFYGLNQYMRALSDADNAIKYIPASDTDLLTQAHALRANIYLMLDHPAEALPDISRAYQLDPKSYALCYQKANIEYELGDYRAAKEDYKRLERLHNRSLEALIGQARVAVAESDYALANELADRAAELYPTTPEVYLRRASVRRQLGNNTGAVDDMLLALSLDSENPKAISAIVDMSNVDYAAVISALSGVIRQAPDQGMFYYIRATIERAHYHYIAAISDYNTIIERRLYDYAGLYCSLADCYYALCRFPQALDEINYALAATHSNASFYMTCSRIHLAMGNAQQALGNVLNALTLAPDNAQAYMQKALCLIDLARFEEASEALGEAIVNAPDDPAGYIVRAWVLTEKLRRPADADRFLQRCVGLDYPSSSISSLRGFALNLLGDNIAARRWIDDIMIVDPTDVDGRIAYLACCLYSHLGDRDRAFECMELALNRGYANLYDWRHSSAANINPAPLRSDPRFERLLSQYPHLFN